MMCNSTMVTHSAKLRCQTSLIWHCTWDLLRHIKSNKAQMSRAWFAQYGHYWQTWQEWPGMTPSTTNTGYQKHAGKKKFAFKVSIASQQNPQKYLCFSEQTILQKRHPLFFPIFWNPPQHPPRQPATTINTHSRECTRLRIMTHYSKLYEGCKKCMRLVNLIVRFVMDSNSRAWTRKIYCNGMWALYQT